MGVGNIGKGVAKVAGYAGEMLGKGASNLSEEKPICFHYILTFNKTRILKNWLREECANSSL